MTLTQRAVYSDLQGFLGVTLTQLPNADATAFLLIGFKRMTKLFELYSFTDDATAQAIQKQAEIYIGAFYAMDSFKEKKYLLAGNSDGSYEGQFSFGGISASSSEANAQKRAQHFENMKDTYMRQYNETIAMLMTKDDERANKASRLL